MSDLAAVDDLLSELGLEAEAAKAAESYVPVKSAGVSAGPGVGRGMSAGPGVGRGVSAGPGVGRGMSAGPGLGRGMSAGPGLGRGMSAGPGLGGGMSAGPGAAAGGHSVHGIQPANRTADGREVNFTGPPCAYCGEMIIGPVVNALEKTWHPVHFVCHGCAKPFPDGSFIEHEGKPYCETDYNHMFGPKCATCFQPITDKCITALGKSYHPEHFYCAGCGTELRGKAYKEDDGEPYCVACKQARTVTVEPSVGICGKCKLPIVGEYITLKGQRMHPAHFRCNECGCEFKGGNCHEYEGELYCYTDYLKMLKNICAGCQKPIVGRSVTALGRVWHPEHFLCNSCHTPIPGSTFFEHEGKAYCEPHYLQQFGRICHNCNRPIEKEAIVALGKNYHKEHFVCSGCEKPLGKDVMDMEGKPMCGNCYNRLPKEIRKRLEKKKEGEKKAQKEREKEAKKEAKEAAKKLAGK